MQLPKGLVTGIAALVLVFTASAQESARGVVDRTQDDLRRASEFERHKGREIARYENAERHLSDFDREITRGHFDKDKLDTANRRSEERGRSQHTRSR